MHWSSRTVCLVVLGICNVGVVAACGSHSDVDPKAFTVNITNRWYPLQPGTRWTYREVEDGQVNDVVVTSTSVTRRVATGVTARIVRDTVSRKGEVLEDTKDLYAQSSDGTVWYLGEDTAEFEGGKLASREGSFEAGVDGAEAGIIMPARPKVGMLYRQEY